MPVFTDSQREAIHSDEPDLAVIAGPGSGKTTVLVNRIARLIESQVRPGSIVAITFTNAAAREIEKRLAVMLAGPGADPEQEPPKVQLGYSGTLHGYCLRLLKSFGNQIGMPSVVSMLGEDEAHDILEAAKADQIVFNCTGKDMKAALALGPEYFLKLKPENLKGAGLVAAAYYRQQLASGVLDFDSLLKWAIMLLETMDAQVPLVVPYLFWDEAQDSGGDDWRIMELIAAQNRFVVGDPDQSIYGFRGARPDLFLRYLRGRHTVTLADNFRCLPEICEAANKLIAHNKGRVEKRTESCVYERGNEAGTVARWMGFDGDGELLALAQEVRKFERFTEAAVLVRTRKLVERVSKSLESCGIPVAANIEGGKPEDWGKARALISLLSNPKNDTLMFWWLVRESGKKIANGLKLTAMKARKPICEIVDRSSGACPAFPLNATASDLPGLMAQHSCSQESIVLVQKAASTLPEGASLTELAHALADEDLHTKQVGKGVTVTTIHSAKGREWEAVYLLAFEEGILPKARPGCETPLEILEEDRRIAFVAVTRAKAILVVSNANARRPMYGRGSPEPAVASRFVSEMGLSVSGE